MTLFVTGIFICSVSLGVIAANVSVKFGGIRGVYTECRKRGEWNMGLENTECGK